MASELTPIDISTMPEVARLAEEVHRTRRPRVLRRGTEDLAELRPVPPRPRRTPKPLTDQYPDIDSLVGAAGSLPEPLSWEEMRAIAAEDRAAAYRAKHR